MITSLGTTAITSNAVAGVLSNIQVIPGMAMAFGTTVVIARCVGAGDFEQVKYYNRKIIGVVYLSQFITCIIIFLMLPQIMRIYELSIETSYLVERIMWMHTLLTILLWPLSYILPATFRATGNARYSMIINILSLFVGRLFCSWLLGIHFQLGVFGIWLGMFADWSIKAFCFILHYCSEKWMHLSPRHSVKTLKCPILKRRVSVQIQHDIALLINRIKM